MQAKEIKYKKERDIDASAGFTLVELIVTIAIFVFITSLVVANYGSFNDGTLLTSMSYDVALSLRDAQSYGLNVQGLSTTTTEVFSSPYGMDFNLSAPSQMVLFADTDPWNGNNTSGDGVYASALDTPVTTYTLARGGMIKCLFVSNSTPPNPPCTPSNGFNSVDITFKRPDPNAIITANGAAGTTYAYAVIQVEDASKTSTRSIVVNETGEISVQNQ